MGIRVIRRVSVLVCAAVQVGLGLTDGNSQHHTARVSQRPGIFFHSSTRDSIALTVVSAPDIIQHTTRGERQHRVLVAGAERLLAPGQPDLPVIRRLIAIPDCDSLVVEARANTKYEIPGIELTSTDVHAERDYQIWYMDSYFPSKSVEIEYTGAIRGQKIAVVRFYPVRFNPRRKMLEVATELRAKLLPVNPRSDVIVSAGPMQRVLATTLANYDVSPSSFMGVQLDAPAYSTAAGQVCWSNTSPNDWAAAAGYVINNCSADYLIITADEVDSSLVHDIAQRRADYNGLDVAVVRMSQIDTTPDVMGTPPVIRSLIDSVYESSSAGHMGDGKLGYVLLVGDAVNPDDEVLIPSFNGFSLEYKGRASDAYYGMMGDEPDVPRIPDLYIGRIPVDLDPDNTEDPNWELRNVVNKILDYEPIPSGASWTDSLLMVSGNNTASFSLPVGGSFQSFFDSIASASIPPSMVVTQMHSLTSGQSKAGFSSSVAAEMASNYWVTGLFDHGAPWYVSGTVYPQDYDILAGDVPTILFSGGSNTGIFDATLDSLVSVPYPEDPWCHLSVNGGTIECRSATTLLDSTDALTERMLLMPNGAVGVFGYSRTTGPDYLQRAFSEFYDALFSDNISTLGELLMATKLRTLHTMDVATLMLMGDPLLNIRWQEGVTDSVDFAVLPYEIKSALPFPYFDLTNAEVSITVRNLWWKDATDVLMEIWDGEPNKPGAAKLDSVGLDLDGHAIVTNTYALELDEGTHEIYVTLDPEDTYDEVSEVNNVASRTFVVIPSYEPGFPRKLDGAPHHSITLSNLAGSDSLEILACVGNERITCFTLNDTDPLWSFHRVNLGTGTPKTAPLVGRFNKWQAPCVVFEAGEASFFDPDFHLYVIDGSTGEPVDSVEIAEYYGSFPEDRQTSVLTDLDSEDSSLEVVTLTSATGFNDSLHIEAYSLDGEPVFATTVGTGQFTIITGMAVADIDANGGKEILICRGKDSSDNYELRVLTYDGGSIAEKWEADLYTKNPTNAAVLPVDLDGDGLMEVFANGGTGVDYLFCFDSNGWI